MNVQIALGTFQAAHTPNFLSVSLRQLGMVIQKQRFFQFQAGQIQFNLDPKTLNGGWFGLE